MCVCVCGGGGGPGSTPGYVGIILGYSPMVTQLNCIELKAAI